MSADDGDVLAAMREMLARAAPTDDDIVLWRMNAATLNALADAAGVVPGDPRRTAATVWAVPVEVVPALPDGTVLGVTRAQRRDELLARLRREEAALQAIRRLTDGTG